MLYNFWYKLNTKFHQIHLVTMDMQHADGPPKCIQLLRFMQGTFKRNEFLTLHMCMD
jgi:hypothetical protein